LDVLAPETPPGFLNRFSDVWLRHSGAEPAISLQCNKKFVAAHQEHFLS
jgi:hypothetical protein